MTVFVAERREAQAAQVAIRSTGMPHSIHIWRSASRHAHPAHGVYTYQRRNTPSASAYPCASLAPYLTRAWMASRSKGRTCSHGGRLDGRESAEEVGHFHSSWWQQRTPSQVR